MCVADPPILARRALTEVDFHLTVVSHEARFAVAHITVYKLNTILRAM
jgi:hypothetical protein